MGIGVDIVVEQENDIYIVSLSGRLDASTTPVIEKKLGKLLEVAHKIAIDFSKISYLSSAGLRLLLSSTKKMQAKEGKIAFFSMSDDVIEIIQMAGFERILHIFPSKKETLKFLA